MNEVKSYPGEKWEKVEFKSTPKHSDYYISNHGRIKRIKRKTQVESQIQGSVDNRGKRILNVTLENSKYNSWYVHKFVAIKFVKPTSQSHDNIVHLNYKILNNHYTNLKWVTRKQWAEHHKSNPFKKTYTREKTDHYKLTPSDVAVIRRMLERGTVKKKVIAKKFDISITHVTRIEKGQNWKEVPAGNV